MRLDYLLLYLSCISAAMLSSCGDGGKSALIAQRDSLLYINDTQQKQIEYFNLFMSTVSSSIDSIANEESMLFVCHDQEKTLTKKEITQRIKALGQLIERQKLRIVQLEDSLKLQSAGKENVVKLQNIITYLSVQLEEKEREIDELRNNLAKTRHSISKLRSDVKALNDSVVVMEKRTATMDNTLSVQDAIINEGFFKIGTKKELESLGIISKGGLFKKQKLHYEKFSETVFTSIDIRNFLEIQLNSKNPKILTPVANGSYEFIKNGNKTTLRILNPTTFWEVSKYLVIQL